MSEILVVDDEPGIRDVLQQILEDEGYDVRLAENGVQARAALQDRTPDLVLLDIWMPDLDGLSLLKEWVAQGRLKMQVIMMSGHGTIKHATEAVRLGAFDFLEKPISFKPLLETIRRALEVSALPPVLLERPEGLGSSEVITNLAHRLRQATSEAPLFLAAEQGAGSEACARFLHVEGTPWYAPTDLQTLADSPIDWLQTAKGGLLFLAEIGNLTPMQQKGLLLILARRSEFGVRLVCASRENLATKEGYSREIYHAMTQSALRVPPLREHREDIPELARAALEAAVLRHGLEAKSFSDAAMEVLTEQPWPGNLDELASVVDGLAMASVAATIERGEVELRLGIKPQGALPTNPGGSSEFDSLLDMPLKDARNAFERIYLVALLKRCKGNVSRAAEISGIERTHLYRVLRKLGVRAGAEEP